MSYRGHCISIVLFICERQMMKIKKSIILMSMMLIVVLLWSCSVDENSDSNKSSSLYRVSLNISSYMNNLTRSVNSSGTDDGTSTEWIKSWTLIVLDCTTSKIEKILTRPAANTGLVESETYDIDLTAGTKTVFALGNVTAAQAGITYAEGTILSSSEIASLKDMTYNSSAGNGFQINATAGTYLPMSNMVNITVNATQQQSFDIPLYRMLAKLEFDFTSDAGEDVTVTSIKMSPMTKDNIYLFPVHVNINADRTDYTQVPLFPTTSTTEEYTYDWTSGNTIAAGSSSATSASFYVNESKGSEYSQHLVFTLTTQRSGMTSEENYTLTDLSFVNRNDYIKIPVVLTDYIFDPSVEYYPPIGGYPDVRVSDDKSYFVFYSGGGEFVITPDLHKSNSTTMVSPKDITVTINSGESIFSTKPVYDATDGVIKGELQGTSGTAVITLSMEVSTGTSLVDRTLTRKIYIVVE